jgi:hypothetical protein
MTILLWVLIVAFGAIGLIHLSGIKAIRDSYTGWGYPERFYLVTGFAEVVTAVLLAIPTTRVWGIALGATICIAAIVTLLRHKQWTHLVGPVLLLAGFAVLEYV